MVGATALARLLYLDGIVMANVQPTARLFIEKLLGCRQMVVARIAVVLNPTLSNKHPRNR